MSTEVEIGTVVEDIEALDFPPTCDPPFGECSATATWVIRLHCNCPSAHLHCDAHVQDAREFMELGNIRCQRCNSSVKDWSIEPLRG